MAVPVFPREGLQGCAVGWPSPGPCFTCCLQSDFHSHRALLSSKSEEVTCLSICLGGALPHPLLPSPPQPLFPQNLLEGQNECGWQSLVQTGAGPLPTLGSQWRVTKLWCGIGSEEAQTLQKRRVQDSVVRGSGSLCRRWGSCIFILESLFVCLFI